MKKNIENIFLRKMGFNKAIDELIGKDIEQLNAFHADQVFMHEEDDDYFCGNRANHFVIETGFSEFYDNKSILISCNHKGIRAISLANGVMDDELKEFIENL